MTGVNNLGILFKLYFYAVFKVYNGYLMRIK